MSKAKPRDLAKERQWQKIIREAACSRMSIREFCRQRGLKESQFYWWQRILKHRRQEHTLGRPEPTRLPKPCGGQDGVKGQTSFALVSEAAGPIAAGIELVLGNGRRLRIGQGVDEATLRSVLAAVESSGC